MDIPRQDMIHHILSYINDHKDSRASQVVCAQILGDKRAQVNDETMRELKARLSRATDEVLSSCYYLTGRGSGGAP